MLADRTEKRQALLQSKIFNLGSVAERPRYEELHLLPDERFGEQLRPSLTWGRPGSTMARGSWLAIDRGGAPASKGAMNLFALGNRAR